MGLGRTLKEKEQGDRKADSRKRGRRSRLKRPEKTKKAEGWNFLTRASSGSEVDKDDEHLLSSPIDERDSAFEGVEEEQLDVAIGDAEGVGAEEEKVLLSSESLVRRQLFLSLL